MTMRECYLSALYLVFNNNTTFQGDFKTKIPTKAGILKRKYGEYYLNEYSNVCACCCWAELPNFITLFNITDALSKSPISI